MEYRRIYQQFIWDRRNNPPGDDELVEVHHIVPKCLGGGDHWRNLIRLTPEDHYFAHLLLAQIHDTRDTWGACVIMSKGRETRGLGSLFRHRKTYGMARRRWDAVNKGWGATNADRTIYRFYHLDGGEFTGTRFEFSAHSGVSRVNASYIVRNVGGVTGGWSLVKTSREEYAARLSDKCSANANSKKNPIRDRALRVYENINTGERRTAYQAEMVASGALISSNSSNLARMKLGTVRQGWRVVQIIAANDNAPSLADVERVAA